VGAELIKALIKHYRITIAIISALTGAVLGAVVQDELNSSFSFLVAIVGILSLAVFALLVSETAREDSRRHTDQQIRDETTAITEEVKRAHDRQRVELDVLKANLTSSIDALGAQLGLRVGRLLQSELSALSSTHVDTSEQMIREAKGELCILDIIAEDGSWPDECMNQGILDRAFQNMLNRVKDSPPSLTYRRILQVADVSVGLRKVKCPTLLQHCRDILKLRQEKVRHASLRLAQRRFPFKFVLIDNSGLILQLQEYSGQGDAFILWGELQVSDPGHNLVTIFRQIWDQIDDADDTRNLNVDDLPDETAE
jgi:hypothetical protein